MGLHQEIENLLEKYFEGTSTTAEEKQLQAYFAGEDVAPHLKVHQPLFTYFKQSRKQSLGTNITLNPKKSRRKAWGWTVAASVAVLLGAGTFAYYNQTEAVSPKSVAMDDPEEAFRQTQKALALLSGHVNTGIEGVSYLKEYEQAKERVFPAH